MVTQSGLYFCRVDEFEDKLEGKLPQAIWDLQNEFSKKWYAENRELVFVSCWQVNDAESAAMWKEYAKNHGVLVFTTVDRLRAALSAPALPPPPPIPPEYAELAKNPGVNIVHYEPSDHDGFTTGLVAYIDRDNVDTYEMMKEGLSSVTPMFRKAKDCNGSA